MSQSSAEPAISAEALYPTASETRLHGRWLVIARVGWLLVVGYTLTLFVGSLPAYYMRLQMPCVGPIACSLNGALTVAGIL